MSPGLPFAPNQIDKLKLAGANTTVGRIAPMKELPPAVVVIAYYC